MNLIKVCKELKRILLSRKIQYINKKNNANILAFVDKKNAPDTIFIYYYPNDKNDDNYIDVYGRLLKYNIKNASVYDYGGTSELKEYYKIMFPDDRINFDFVFNIIPSEKTIYTKIEYFGYKGGQNYYIGDVYTNTDTQKILKDLIANNIISNDYTLVINNKSIPVKEIINKVNTPIRQSKNGNMVLFHGTSKKNWESIKKHGGLIPDYNNSTRKNYGYIKGISNTSIYLTSSFNVAKSYATSHGNKNDAIVLLVEVPDMNLLYPDDDYISDLIEMWFEQLLKEKSTFNNPALQKIRNMLSYDGIYTAEFMFDDAIISIYEMYMNSQVFIDAILNNDFNILVKSLNLDSIETKAYKIIYDFLVEVVGRYLHTTSAIRNSLNSKEYSNAVSYRGRIPMSFIQGAFDINGNNYDELNQ